MKPQQNTLTDAEMLILLEGDVSDVDLDLSDDELNLVSDRNEHAVPTSPGTPGLDPEMIEVRLGEEEDLDDFSEWGCRSTSCPGDITQWIKI